MSNPEWPDRIDWNELTTVLNNLDPDYVYELRGEYNIWSRIWSRTPEVLVGVDHIWSEVLDPIGTLIRLKNLAKAAVEQANGIIVDAIKHGYKER